MSAIKTVGAAWAPPLTASLFLLLTPIPQAAAGENALNLQPASFKSVAAGTKLTWSETSGDRTGEQVFTGGDGYKVTYTWRGNDRAAYVLCMWCASRGAEIDEKVYAKLWPLDVGKALSIDRKSGRGSWTNKITVEGTEKVKLAFGTVETYRVVNKSDSHNSDWWGTRTY